MKTIKPVDIITEIPPQNINEKLEVLRFKINEVIEVLNNIK